MESYKILPLVTIYLSDLRKIVDLLEDNFPGKVHLEGDQESFETIAAIQEYDTDSLKALTIRTSKPNISVIISPENCVIVYPRETKIIGVISQIEEILDARSRKTLDFLTNPIRIMPVFITVIPICIPLVFISTLLLNENVSKNIMKLLIFGYSLLSLFLVGYYLSFKRLRLRYSGVVLSTKKNATATETKYRRELLLVLIGAFLGLVIAIITAPITYFLTKSSCPG